MEHSLEEYLALLQPYFPPTFTGNIYVERIRKIARQLPVLSYGYFECFFGKDCERVDFNVSITGIYNEHKQVYNWFTNEGLISDPVSRATFKEVEPFFRDWIRDDFHLKPFIDEFWLAYDICNPDQESIHPWYYISFTSVPLNQIPSFKATVVARTLGYFPECFNDGLKEQLYSFFSSLSPAILVKSIGIQQNRSVHSLRVYLVMTDYEEVFRFLVQFHWPDSVEDLRHSLDSFALDCPLYGLLVDIGPTLQPKIGVELWFRAERPNRMLEDFLDKLIHTGLCTPEQKQSFMDWEGEFTIPHMPNFWAWPTDYLASPDRIAKTVVIRKMARYLKLVYQNGKMLMAKGYLGFDRPIGGS